MATTGTAKAKEKALPKSATIRIRNQEPRPCGRVEVAPWTGRVRFVNQDKEDYRLRFYKPDTEPLKGIDILLPARNSVTVLIKQGDEFFYGVLPKDDRVALGKGGGPIVN